MSLLDTEDKNNTQITTDYLFSNDWSLRKLTMPLKIYGIGKELTNEIWTKEIIVGRTYRDICCFLIYSQETNTIYFTDYGINTVVETVFDFEFAIDHYKQMKRKNYGIA